MGMSKINMAGSSIDIVDLMGLQADVQRAFHEGLIQDQDFNKFMAASARLTPGRLATRSRCRGGGSVQRAVPQQPPTRTLTG